MKKNVDHERDVRYFDRWSRRYEESWMQRALFDPAHRAALVLAAEYVQHPGAVLDVGCGTGRLLREVRTWWPDTHVVGVDPAEGMVEVARRLTPGGTFYVGAGEALPLEDASVDLALSTISFHHWRDQAAGVREVARVLRLGGYFVLVDFSFPGWVLRLARQTRVHTPDEMRALFDQAELRVQQQRRVAWRGWLATVGKK